MLVCVSAHKGHSEMLGLHGHGCVSKYVGVQAQMDQESMYMHADYREEEALPPQPPAPHLFSGLGDWASERSLRYATGAGLMEAASVQCPAWCQACARAL